MATPREKFEETLRRMDEERQEYARDMKELERLFVKYEIVAIASSYEEPDLAKKAGRGIVAAREAEGIIRTAGHPMPLNELFKILTIDRGFELGGIKPSSGLATALATSSKVQFLKDYGWWIRGVPWPLTAEEIAKFKAGSLDNESVEGEPPKLKKVGPAQSAEKKALFEGIRSLLKGRSEPMVFAELFDRLAAAGLSVGGQDERKNLAVFLGKYSCFMNEGRKRGWRYVAERDFEGPNPDEALRLQDEALSKVIRQTRAPESLEFPVPKKNKFAVEEDDDSDESTN
jgi:hypothetical protein